MRFSIEDVILILHITSAESFKRIELLINIEPIHLRKLLVTVSSVTSLVDVDDDLLLLLDRNIILLRHLSLLPLALWLVLALLLLFKCEFILLKLKLLLFNLHGLLLHCVLVHSILLHKNLLLLHLLLLHHLGILSLLLILLHLSLLSELLVLHSHLLLLLHHLLLLHVLLITIGKSVVVVSTILSDLKITIIITKLIEWSTLNSSIIPLSICHLELSL